MELIEGGILRGKVLREYNAVRKDISRVDVLFGYCYPSTYRAGMTGLASHLFYSILNQREDTSCERYFRYDVPSAVHSVETARKLEDNHIVGFSLTYEEDIINLVQMLTQAGISAESKSRRANDPIVLVGGPAVSANPEPYADIVDVFVIGEGDLVISEIIEIVKNSKSRDESILSLAGLEGVYVPDVSTHVKRLIIQDVDPLFHPTAQVIPFEDEEQKLDSVFGRSLLVEVSRGCGHSCKFCLIGHVCRPRRVRSLQRLIDIIEQGLQETPVRKVSLIASSLGDLDSLDSLSTWIVDQELELSVPSLRADTVTLELLHALHRGGQRTLTIAPETGSARLRRDLGKGLSDDAIFKAAELAAETRYLSIKAYYIVGLPGETVDDVSSIAEMSKAIAEISGLRVVANVNPFIPKAQTRWETKPQPTLSEMRSKFKQIEDELKNVSRVKTEFLDPRNARIQAALSIGDRTLGRVIIEAAKYGGLGGWRRAEKNTGIPFFEIASQENRNKATLPWKFINN